MADDDEAATATGEDDGPKAPGSRLARGGASAAVYDVPIEVYAVLGSAHMQISQLLKMGRGAVVELDRKVGEPVNVLANGQLIARGEVVVVEDRLGVAMTEILKTDIT